MEDLEEQPPVDEATETAEKDEKEDTKENNVEYTKNLDEAKHFMECKICFIDFDNDQHVPLGLQCGHSICSTCIPMILMSD